MLDVHPPHQPVHGLRDFLVHLSTITVGLLIALALEACVEWMHHRHQVEEVREALLLERKENRKRFVEDTAFTRQDAALLQNDLLVLRFCQKYPGTPESNLPGVFFLTNSYQRSVASAWTMAQATSVTALMPQDEVQGTAELYSFFDRVDRAHEEEADALADAVSFMSEDPRVSHLSPAQIDKEIELLHRVAAKHLRHAFLMQNLAEEHADFRPGPSREELEQWLHLDEMSKDETLTNARLLTKQRIDSAVSQAGVAHQ
jgi:hypothetical protein